MISSSTMGVRTIGTIDWNIEQIDDLLVGIIWGARGQSSAALPVEDVKAAADVGNLVLLG